MVVGDCPDGEAVGVIGVVMVCLILPTVARWVASLALVVGRLVGLWLGELGMLEAGSAGL